MYSMWVERRFSQMFQKKDPIMSKSPVLITEAQVDASQNIFTQDTVVNSVIQQLIDRSKFGMTKYGTTLDRDDLDLLDWIEHSKQEAMDFVLYLEKMKRVISSRMDVEAHMDVIPEPPTHSPLINEVRIPTLRSGITPKDLPVFLRSGSPTLSLLEEVRLEESPTVIYKN